MSLTTDKFFYNALKDDEDIITLTEGRIFNTARPTEDENEDKIPYIIITFDSLTNDGTTKDSWEGITDRVNISLLAVASTREALADLTTAMRATIHEYYEDCQSGTVDDDDCPDDYFFTAGRIDYDMLKPCYYQTMRYECSTLNTLA